MKPGLLSLILLWAFLLPISAQEKPSAAAIDDLLFDAGLWDKSLVGIRGGDPPVSIAEKHFREEMSAKGTPLPPRRKFGLDWISSGQADLHAPRGAYTLLGRTTGEINLRGRDGKPAEVAISLYNRGDDGEITPAKFETELNAWKTALEARLRVRSEDRGSGGALQIRGWMWRAGDTAFLLEGSVNRAEKRPEFIRLRLASLGATSSLGGHKRARRDSFAENVKKDHHGFTFVKGIPMVDQGQKGYCVVATVERIGRYFGSSVDQHEMAQLANTGAESEGTSIQGMEKAFQRITGRIHLRTIKHLGIEPRQLDRDVKEYNRAAEKAGKNILEYDPRREILNPVAFWQMADAEVFRSVKREQNGFERFESKIKTYVDQGLPLCWTLYLGMFPEPGLPQAGGGHMRIIYGYHFDSEDPAEHKILYTDSWGPGHERKEMSADAAFAMTTALYSMVPTN